jgi:hypothetical protein
VHQPHAKTAQDITRPALGATKDSIRVVKSLYETFHKVSRHRFKEVPAFVKNGFQKFWNVHQLILSAMSYPGGKV